MDWTWGDFAVAIALLLGAGLLAAFVVSRVHSPRPRAALVAGVMLLLLLVWTELAVGVVGTRVAGF